MMMMMMMIMRLKMRMMILLMPTSSWTGESNDVATATLT